MNEPHTPHHLKTAGTASEPRLTVIIVNYESWPDVIQLTALAGGPSPSSRRGSCQIVVVDNASRGPMPEALSASDPVCGWSSRPDNGGFAAGVNAGWRVAQKPLAAGPQSRCGSRERIPGPGLRATRSIRVRARAVRRGSSGSACETPTARPRLGRRLPQPRPDHPGAVHTAFPAGNTSPVGEFAPVPSTGSPVRACW